MHKHTKKYTKNVKNVKNTLKKYTKNDHGNKKNARKCYLSSWQTKKCHLMCLKSMTSNCEEVISEINNWIGKIYLP